MLKILLFIIIGIIILAIEVPSMRKKNLKKELKLYVVFLIAGIILVSLISLDIKVPSTASILESMFNPLNRLISKIL
ncbi:hypothetical protein SAMN05660462_00996 [Proteiniborus ethanoligenes]|uniref:Stage III sporulation protein AF n=1 Tax=Proteiniborus ethanoligenes TaxID=415015 RepID=A0A1H3N072_9FIRM|nr:hypothetical protein [Proteiniborus ethanoligenes]TAH63343.1 MAG: hypothetical protein EWM50_03055 [Gottschalkiaceae bacterium]SDY82351.1 hypothetical protein SAMN05660462_00996 [Proteiniborus ethanoligenes]